MAKPAPSRPSSFQVALFVIFALSLAVCLGVFVAGTSNSTSMVTLIGFMAGGLIISAVLTQVEEFGIGPKGFSAKLRELRQDVDILLKFLVHGYVTHWELEHLRKLADSAPFPYRRGDTFLEELRRLWRHGLIKKVEKDWFLAHLPKEGDLKSYLAITKRGLLYLELLDQVPPDAELNDPDAGYLDQG